VGFSGIVDRVVDVVVVVVFSGCDAQPPNVNKHANAKQAPIQILMPPLYRRTASRASHRRAFHVGGNGLPDYFFFGGVFSSLIRVAFTITISGGAKLTSQRIGCLVPGRKR
jgi:hypothetical protein